MTLQEFEHYYYISTGIVRLTVQNIVSHIPESYNDKIYYFIKLERNIELLYNRYHDCDEDFENVYKYGRFDKWGNSSSLTNKLIEIIFGTSTGKEIDNDANTTTTPIISTYNSLEDITNKIEGNFYLVKSENFDDNIYEGYTYSNGLFSKKSKYYYIHNTEQTFTNTNQLPSYIYNSQVELPSDYTDFDNLIIIYQANTNSYVEFEYNSTTNNWKNNDTVYNDGNDLIDLGIQYLLTEDGEYVLTHDGRTIIVK